jgi:hypothetical protein
MWLLRSGLVQIDDTFCEGVLDKFKFFLNGQELNSLKDIQNGVTVEVRSVNFKEESKQEPQPIKQKKPKDISSLVMGSFDHSSSSSESSSSIK